MISATQNITVSANGTSGSIFTINANKDITKKGLDLICGNGATGRCISIMED
ncbi:MAG: hypothetical protein IPO92_18590 [Saprospiraceae bacterium]|nr:hypothetical protein [Saprospiraceae bacterium]